MARRQRLDAELVRRQLCETTQDALAVITAGRVLVNGSAADKPTHQVHAGDAIVVLGVPPQYVSRGGEKLAAALDGFGIDVAGMRALDAGASTGGFTDCLLQRGAKEVVALDVGHGQLHPRIRADERVRVIERFNVKEVTSATVGGRVDIVVADLSFISLVSVIAPLTRACKPLAPMVLLVKPQFEAGRADVDRGKGVITDPVIHRWVLDRVANGLRAAGCTVKKWLDSPLKGADGNREFLVYALAPRPGLPL